MIGKFIKLTDVNNANEKEKQFFNSSLYYQMDLREIASIPSQPLNYWITDKKAKNFNEKLLSSSMNGRTGLICGKNDKYIRYWWEPKFNNISFDCCSIEDTINKKVKWFPYNHGGTRVKWYGNHLEVVDFYNQAQNIKNEPNSMLRNSFSYFKKGITWNRVGSGMKFSARIALPGFVFDDVSPLGEISDDKSLYTLAFMNTVVFNDYLRMFCTALKVEIGHIGNVPFIYKKCDNIDYLSQSNIELAMNNWNENEVSYEFKKNPLI